MDSKDRKKYNPFMSMEAEKQVPPQVVLDAFGPGGLEVEEGRHVSISDEKKVTADHGTGRIQERDLVCVLGTKSETGRTLETRARLERLVGNNSVQTSALFLREPPGLEGQGDVGKYFLLSDFLKDRR